MPSLGSRPSLPATIDSLLQQSWPPDEVIVVLPHATPRPPGVPASVTVLWADRSSAGQRNAGLLACGTPLVLLVDDDIVVDKGAPRLLAQALSGEEALLAAATLIGDPALPPPVNLLYRLLGLGHHNPWRGNSRLRWSGHPVIRLEPVGIERVGFAHLCCTMVRRIEASATLLDESFAGYVIGEDLDFTARLGRLGTLLSVEEAVAAIEPSASTSPTDQFDLGRLHGEVLAHYRWRHKRSGPLGVVAWWWAHLGQILVLAGRTVSTRDRRALAGYLSGFRRFRRRQRAARRSPGAGTVGRPRSQSEPAKPIQRG